MVEVQLQSLQHLHTFALKASCNMVSTVDSVDSLIELLKQLGNNPFLILGEGSNTIFIEDYPATVIVNKIKGIKHTSDDSFDYLYVGAGENWHHLVEFCIQNGIGGFENLALIPGTVGAAPIQNIGAYGVEVKQFIERVDFINTSDMSCNFLLNSQCEFAYRDSTFKRQKLNQRIITHVHFVLPKRYTLETSYGPLNDMQQPTAKQIFEQVIKIRQAKLPNVAKLGNAGSFFKNPVISKELFIQLQDKFPNMPFYNVLDTHSQRQAEQVKVPAAWLIDQLGFKGTQLGQIGCHVTQPLVLVNLGKGEGTDLLLLARKIRDSVQQTFGITLENEVRLMGKQGLITL